MAVSFFIKWHLSSKIWKKVDNSNLREWRLSFTVKTCSLKWVSKTFFFYRSLQSFHSEPRQLYCLVRRNFVLDSSSKTGHTDFCLLIVSLQSSWLFCYSHLGLCLLWLHVRTLCRLRLRTVGKVGRVPHIERRWHGRSVSYMGWSLHRNTHISESAFKGIFHYYASAPVCYCLSSTNIGRRVSICYRWMDPEGFTWQASNVIFVCGCYDNCVPSELSWNLDDKIDQFCIAETLKFWLISRATFMYNLVC